MCKYVNASLLVLLFVVTLGLSQSYASEIDVGTVEKKESEARVVIISPERELSVRDKLLPKTSGVKNNKLFVSGVLLSLGGAYWIKYRMRKKEQEP